MTAHSGGKPDSRTIINFCSSLDETGIKKIVAGLSIAQLLRMATFDMIDTRLLVAHALRLSRTQLITQSDHLLSPKEARQVADLFARRLAGEPVAYILGSREFYGLSLHVNCAVLIPRADTELLVDLALERAGPGASVADLGTGSGAIAVAIGRNRADLHLTATDMSDAALDVARQNAALHRVRVRFLQGDWLAALGEERFDMIVSNPPYIVAGDTHLSQGDLPFEPIDALTDHADGLSALRCIVNNAGTHLKPGGWILLEHGYDQAAAVRDLLMHNDFKQVQCWTDLAGIERVSGAIMPG